MFSLRARIFIYYLKKSVKKWETGGGVLRADNESAFDRRKNKKRGQTSKQNCQQNA